MKQKILIILIFVSIIVSSLYFGFPRLEKFSGVDEPYWSYDRVPKFWNAIKTKQWKKTNLCDKPGIVLAMVSGIGLPFDGEDYESIKNLKKLRYEPKTPEDVQRIENLYFHLRLPVFLFTLAVLPLFYFFIRKLLGHSTAVFAIVFIGLSPILLGISLIINSDAMLWILAGLSILSLFVFLKDGQKKYLFISGFLLGASVITKYVANVLFVYFFLVFLMEYFLHARQKMEVREYLKQALINYAILFGTAIATAFILFPATWVKFSTLVNATIGNDVFSSTWPLFVGIIGFFALDTYFFKTKFSTIIFDFLAKYRKILIKTVGAAFLLLVVIVFIHVYAGIKIFDIEELIASPKGIGSGNILYKYSGAITADVYSLIFSISPLILLFFIFSIFSLFYAKKELERRDITTFYILVFILIFYLGSAVNEVTTTVRYQIVTYPLVFVLAAIGITSFLRIKKVKKVIPKIAALIAVFVILEFSLFFVNPNFLAYASEILPKKFIVNLKGMGEGSYEAANYLNRLPDAHNMIIWSDKGAVCERFVGKCFIDFKKKTFSENKIDYFVLSTDRRSRTFKLSGGIKIYNNANETSKDAIGFVDYKYLYSIDNAEKGIIINNNPNNFVKIIKTEKLFQEYAPR